MRGALTEFLLARITEDEGLARMAADVEGADEWAVFSSDVPDLDGAVGTMSHIVRHDPARVLAECEAKRRIVEEHVYLQGMQQDATIAAKQEQARMEEDPAMTDVYSCVDLHWHYRLLHQRP